MKLDDDKKRKSLIKAEALSEDFDPDEAKEFAEKHKNAKWYDDFVLLYNMVTDKQFKLDKKTYIAIAGALAYVVLPIDIVPDFIPGVGFIDDVFVVGIVMKSISDEIERFKVHNEEV